MLYYPQELSFAVSYLGKKYGLKDVSEAFFFSFYLYLGKDSKALKKNPAYGRY